MNAIKLKSEDIHCQACAASVTRALTAVAGVANVSVDVDNQTVVVHFDEPATEESIRTAMDDAGFAVASSN